MTNPSLESHFKTDLPKVSSLKNNNSTLKANEENDNYQCSKIFIRNHHQKSAHNDHIKTADCKLFISMKRIKMLRKNRMFQGYHHKYHIVVTTGIIQVNKKQPAKIDIDQKKRKNNRRIFQ